LGFLLFILEKILTSVLLSILIFLLTLSYTSGRFPPSKTQIYQTLNLLKSTLETVNETKEKQARLPVNPSLEQVFEIQKLVLKRTELAMALMNQFKVFQGKAIHPVIQIQMEKISKTLDQAGSELELLNKYIEKMKENPQASTDTSF
jgi:hypothetical protein